MKRTMKQALRQKGKWGAAAASAALLLTSCALLPVEEELPEAPSAASAAEYGYNTVSVERGDLIREASATVEYQPSTEEKLYFSLDGERIDRLYVQKGDTVEKGQLIAELDMGNIPAEITSQENRIREMELQQVHLEETLELTASQNAKKTGSARKKLQEAEKALEAAGGAAEEEKKELQEAVNTAQQELEALEAETSSGERGLQEQITSLKEQLAVQREKLEELQEKKKQRQLYSSINGTVQSTVNVESNPISSTSTSIAVVQDYTTAVFVMEGENCRYFKEGEAVEITLKDESTAAAKVTKVFGGEEPKVYFSLDVPDPSLGKSSSGKVSKILEKREDVLYVPAEAVAVSEGNAYVYTLDEHSLRCLQPVKTGMEAGDYIEITEGLEEGDPVIVE